MHRCLQLASLGAAGVGSNPMVGAVLVYEGRIIGEGFHEEFGHSHAEVNCIKSVSSVDKHLIRESTLYVSLEPCNHHGKTPPCCDLIIESGIKRVVIAVEDPFIRAGGSGVRRLRESGIDVRTGILAKEGFWLNRRFLTFVTKNRPYVILKWAQSADGKIAGEGSRQRKISNELTDRLVHKWRGEEHAIMVGTNTALNDDPLLTTRLWNGRQPLRVVVDRSLRLNASLNLFSSGHPTLVMNEIADEETSLVNRVKYDPTTGLITATLNELYRQNKTSLLVEGGARLLQSFIDHGLWDEARVITNTELFIGDGVDAPVLTDFSLNDEHNLLSDSLRYFRHTAGHT